MLTLSALIESLSHENYLSGQILADRFAVTRATINNHVSRLQQLGVQIECVSGRGYRLQYPVHLHIASKIKASLDGSLVRSLKELSCQHEIASTNQAMHSFELPAEGQFSVLTAERQTAGRGRRGRTWVAPYASNITMSLLWNFQGGMQNVGLLSPFLAVQIAQVLTEMGLSRVQVKWPNDIYCDGQKLAGILIECSGEVNANCRMVVGLGLNVFMSQRSSETSQQMIDQVWTDMITQYPEMTLGRDEIASACINALANALKRYENQDGRSYEAFSMDFCDTWHQWDWLANKAVRVESETSTIHGVAAGITHAGGLRLLMPEGEQEILMGEVSVRAENDKDNTSVCADLKK
jgi:BirA family biotin operon repressor/biotin-[acetyl-CoA-carboxylase] ligase